ncbi:MAG: nucleotidyltransferase/DNA polymerase protein [Candidatus Magasanikbacteria bacterium]|nr:nucleotidyltransferase/DNA polymerase protein [Candidatus Magasanikbacteria bacterium]
MHTPFILSSFPRAILHVDGDAFFASCEQAVHPEYKGLPVITGKERGIVSAASYEAKAYGVSRGVPLSEVKKLCPNAIILPSDYETYSLFSLRLYAIIRRFTSQVEEYSIDEAFADLTGLRRTLRASYEDMAGQIQKRIHKELGITVSVGLAPSKVLAKVASKWKKPAGLTVIRGRNIHDYLEKYPVEKIWGIGSQTTTFLNKYGIKTALQYAEQSEEWISAQLSKPFQEIWRELRGESILPVTTEPKDTYASIGKSKTFTPSSSNKNYVFAQLAKNIENASIKARRYGLLAKRLIIYLRTQDFRHTGVEAQLSRASAFPNELLVAAQNLFGQIFNEHEQYRATGVVLMDFVSQDSLQLSLFERPLTVNNLRALYEAIDSLDARFGKHTVFAGAAFPAYQTPTYVGDRAELAGRKKHRIKGETNRQRLSVPMIMKEVR